MKVYTHTQKLMGSVFTLGLVSASEVHAREMLDKGIREISRIEDLLSEFKPGSETSRINQAAVQEVVPLSEECFLLISRCMDISRLTKGDFDITVGPLKKLYNFKNKQFCLPEPDVRKAALARVGYRLLILDKAKMQLRLAQPSMHISFAAIGKGYASERVKQIWLREGIRSGYINASGDLCAFGMKPEGAAWQVGIAHPDQPAAYIAFVPLHNAAVATSGDYEQHFWWAGARYSHNINPHTGMPLSGIKSVSVFSPNAELSDALATAVYVKGVAKGLAFINQLPQTHCMIIDAHNEVHVSAGLQYSVSHQNK